MLNQKNKRIFEKNKKMIQSMTGYGRTIADLPRKKVMVEIKTLNSKQLDVTVKIPAIYRDKEIEIRKHLLQHMVRGKIDFSIFVEIKEGVPERKLQPSILKNYFEQIRSISNELGVEKHTILDAVIRIPDVWSIENQSLANEEEWESVKKAICLATEDTIQYRKNEGNALEKDLRTNISSILSLMNELEPHEHLRIEKIKNKIETTLQETIETDKIDKNRLEQEMIYYIEKIDVNEEKVRLKQHCKYFIDTMEKEQNAGRKLNFISQEIGREINTLGSKSNDAHMQRIVVQMKENLEKIKEQVLNVL